MRPGGRSTSLRAGHAAVAVALAAAAATGVTAMQDRRYVPAGLPADALYSGAVAAGGFVFVSAVTGAEADGKLGGTIDAQTRRTIERLGAVLTAAGSSLEQVVSMQVYLRNASDFQAMNEAYRPFFADKPPVRTTVVTD